MLDPRWIYVALALLVYSLARGHALLSLCATLGLALSLGAALTRRFGLSGVSYRRSLAARQAQFGDTIELRVELDNLKLLPLAALSVEDQLPRFLTIEGGSVRPGMLGIPQLCITRAMRPYERVRRRLRVRCMRRGYHQFGPARWDATDYLGARSQHRTDPRVDGLLVLPKVFPLHLAGALSRQLLGRSRAPEHMLSDPLRIVGARDYAAGDPLRMVDWRASARRGDLMVRLLEPSATPTLELALDFRVAAARSDRVEPDELEYTISVAASLARHAAERAWRVGLCSNGLADGVPVALPPSSAPTHLRTMLELLARAGSTAQRPLAEQLRMRAVRADSGSTLVVITAALDDALRAILLELARRRRSVLLVLTSADAMAVPSTIPSLLAPYGEGWTERETLVLSA